ncbi:hypothetical protein D3C71_666770 [compost metagenome]
MNFEFFENGLTAVQNQISVNVIELSGIVLQAEIDIVQQSISVSIHNFNGRFIVFKDRFKVKIRVYFHLPGKFCYFRNVEQTVNNLQIERAFCRTAITWF